MPILHVRNVPIELYGRLKSQAVLHRRSLSAEVIDLLEFGLAERERRVDVHELVEGIRKIAAQSKPLPDGLTVADLVREDRESH